MELLRKRWLPAAMVAGLLLMVNIVVRLVVRLVADSDESKQTWIGAIAMAALGLVVLAAAVRWVREHPMPRAIGDLAVAAGVGSLLSALVGPFVSSGEAFGNGFGGFLLQLSLYLVVCAIGALFGALGVMVVGADHKARNWKRFEERIMARPRRPTRR